VNNCSSRELTHSEISFVAEVEKKFGSTIAEETSEFLLGVREYFSSEISYEKLIQIFTLAESFGINMSKTHAPAGST